MNRSLKILLSLSSLRKALGFNNFIAAAKFDHHLQLDPSLNFRSILVLAPHPDDDVFGCGGTIAKLSKKDARVMVAYFCDGSGGIPEKSLKELERRAEQKEIGSDIARDRNLVNVRKEEAKKAGEILNIKEQIFFGYLDGKLAAGQAVVKAFDDLIRRVKPDIIFTPSFLDNHPDHRAVNEVLINSNAKDINNLQIWAYEVWTPIYTNRIVDIGPEVELKKKAVLAHQSQLESRAYDQAILGLNQYRAEINGISGHAEGFFASTAEIYRKLYQKS